MNIHTNTHENITRRKNRRPSHDDFILRNIHHP